MKRAMLVALQVIAGCFIWFWAVIFWKHWLPFYTFVDYEVSRIQAKGISIMVILFVLANYATYSIRRRIFR